MHNRGNRSVYTGELRSRSSPLFALPGYGLCASTSPKPCEQLTIDFFLKLASRGRRGRRSRGGRGDSRDGDGSRRRRREDGELRSNKPLQPATSTGFGLASFYMQPKKRKEIAQISFFESLVKSPFTFRC